MFDYCGTCHSSEGASSNGKVCVFDYKNKLVSWRWLWTAMTRPTQIENDYFYIYNIAKEDKFNNDLVRSQFEK